MHIGWGGGGLANRLRNFLVRFEVQISYILALVLGLAVFHLVFNAPVFLQLFWGLDGPNDFSQHLTGFYAFRSSPWAFPLLWTGQIGSPAGLNIYFTDSIPLFALPFKLLAPLFSPDFHYFKLWVLLSYLLQPASAVYLVRKLGQRGIPAAFFAAAFSLLVKWFLFRFNHEALDAQFVLIFALALYVEQVRCAGRGLRAGFPAGRWLLLILTAFLIHSYLTAMVLGIYVAAILDGRFALPTLKLRWLYRLNLLALPAVALVCAYAALIGLNTLQGLPPVDGYSYYSMNLTGPFYGGNLLHLPASLGPSSGQVYEDQSYLGLGLMGVIAAASWVERKDLLKRLWRCRALAVVLLGFLLFSISTDVYFGLERIYRYPTWLTDLILASPLSQFRASARFFWPVGYCLLFWGLAVILRQRWAVPVLAGLLVIQAVDVPKPFWPRPANYAQAFNPDFAAWDDLFQGKRSLYLYPTYACGGDADSIGLPAVLVAAKDGVTSNTASIARFTDDCAEKVALGLADFSSGTVHLFTRPAEYQAVLQEHPGWCAARPEMAVCIPYPDAKDRSFLAALDALALPKAPRFYSP